MPKQILKLSFLFGLYCVLFTIGSTNSAQAIMDEESGHFGSMSVNQENPSRLLSLEDAEAAKIARENDPNNWPQAVETQVEEVRSWQQGLGPRERYLSPGVWSLAPRESYSQRFSRWPLINKEMSVTITRNRTVAIRPNSPQMVVLVDWQEASRTTPAPTGVQHQIGWEY